MSLDALLSQAGIPPDEVLEMLPDSDEPSKSPEQKQAEALKSAAALADLPGMPGFLKPTRTPKAVEAARADEEKKQKEAEESSAATATATVDAAGSNGQGFKVTVMVSPDDETSKEAAALRESATSSKPEPNVLESPYGNGAGVDERYYPKNQAAGSGFGGVPRSSAAAPAIDPFGVPSDPVPSFDPADAAFFDAPAIDPFGPRSAISSAMPVPGANAPGVMGGFGDGFGSGAVTYEPGVASAPPFPPSMSGFDPYGPSMPPVSGGGFGLPTDGVPLTDEEAAAAAMAAQNAAMVDAMVRFGPDAVPEEDKKRFFGKKKRERAAKKAAAEAAAFAAAEAVAAAEAAAAEEAARRRPTAYVPTAPPAVPVESGTETLEVPTMGFDAPAFDAMGTTQIPVSAPRPQDAPADAASQAFPEVQAEADMSGYDHFAAPPVGAPVYGAGDMQDPSITTGMPPVGAVMGADGSYLSDAAGLPLGYDQYGYGSDGTGVTPEGVAALEAMRSEMNDASDAHRKRVRTIKIIVGSVLGLIAAAVITLAILIGVGVIPLDTGASEAPQNSSSATSSSTSNSLSYRSSSSSSAASSNSSASTSDSSEAPSDPSSPSSPSVDPGSSSSGGSTPTSQAGDEVYHYTLTTIDGEHPQVTEVVTYDNDGYCIQTAMDAVFSTATAAQAFVERVRSDYGSNFLSGSVDGTTAHVVVNMERAKLTREGYEDALRGVVDGLDIERLA